MGVGYPAGNGSGYSGGEGIGYGRNVEGSGWTLGVPLGTPTGSNGGSQNRGNGAMGNGEEGNGNQGGRATNGYPHHNGMGTLEALQLPLEGYASERRGMETQRIEQVDQGERGMRREQKSRQPSEKDGTGRMTRWRTMGTWKTYATIPMIAVSHN